MVLRTEHHAASYYSQNRSRVITAGGNSGRRWFHHTFVFATGWRAVDTELGVSARHLWMGPGIMLIGAVEVEGSYGAVLMSNRSGKMCIESADSQ